MTSPQFDQGKEAAIAHKSVWENPYAGTDINHHKFLQWFEGWCCGKRENAAQQRESFDKLFPPA